MSSTAPSRKNACHPLLTPSLPSSSSNSISATPDDTPSQSRSSTSLSSLASDSDRDVKESVGNLVNSKQLSNMVDTELSDQWVSSEARYGKLVDTYGNEFQVPDFTINDVRAAIPKHCFERSALRGLMYVARDLFSLATTFAVFHTFWTPANVPSSTVRAAGWALYTFIQGCFGTGLWVMAHECGHQSFSPSKTINDTVGFFCHSALLVPYFSWKISHGKHHKATGHLERDMVFVPKTREQYASKIGRAAHELAELAEETPIVTAGSLIGQQLAGWLLYLSINITGHNCHTRQKEGRGQGKKNGWGGNVNHFDPASPLYEAKDSKLIFASDLGLALVAAILILIGKKFGWANLAVWYFLPYLWVNHWLVAITYLQHTDPSLPHYEDAAWNFTRGAAATVDRDFGFIVILEQSQYAEKVLRDYGMDQAVPVSTPIDGYTSLEPSQPNEARASQQDYQKRIGSLMYLMTCTRPDLAFAVSKLSQFCADPTVRHMNALNRVLRYLRGTTYYGLRYQATGDPVGYADSAYGDDKNDRKSTYGFVLLCGQAACIWYSHKQRDVTTSTTEAEYVSLTEAGKTIVWATKWMKDLQFMPANGDPITLFGDNKGSNALTVNPEHHSRTKHIDIKYHYIRQLVEDKEVDIQYIPTAEMVADILTKPLNASAFERGRQLLGMYDCSHKYESPSTSGKARR